MNQPKAARAQMRQAAGFSLQLGPSLAGYPGIPALLIMESKLCELAHLLLLHNTARTRVDKAPYKPWHSQNPSLLIRSHAVGWRASTETEISMA